VLLDIAECESHNDTQIASRTPLDVITPAAQWSYAVSIASPATAGSEVSGAIVVTARLDVRQGRVGVGWTRAHSDAFVVEKHVTPDGPNAVAIRVSPQDLPGRLMFRNVNPSGTSRFVLRSVDARVDADTRPYPVTVGHRDVAAEAALAEGQQVFNDDLARAINTARLEFLAGLDLPLAGKRVLDAGCGVGHHSAFYTERGCRVVGIDGRADNIETMKRLYPSVEGYVGDVQEMPLERLGMFDVVHCFGLLYHLDSPVAALRRLAAVCRDLLIIETMVCDSAAPVMVLVDENASANQALAGLGCRPSPGFVTMALNRIGFQYVYGSDTRPKFPDFQFEWRNNLDVIRDGQNLRCIFLASRTPVEAPSLKNLVSTA
jgi:2-polyprenyl-3-methyl-5-hydroxy-6-metoxy-1,4-benzoquinol methylase